MDSVNRFLSYKEYHKSEVIFLKFIINELPKLIPNVNTDDFEFREMFVNPPHAVKPRIKTTDNAKQHQLYRYILLTIRSSGTPRKEFKVILRLRIMSPPGQKIYVYIDGYMLLHQTASEIIEVDITGMEFILVAEK